MTPEQIAFATLELQKWQTWITALAIVLGPLFGVLFTLWSQGRKERRDARMRLFTVLLGSRKGLVTPDVARALNSITVVYAGCEGVCELWRRYYTLLSQPAGEELGHVWLQLLGAMATNLGYKNLTAVELYKFYIPQGHVDDAQFRQRMGKHWERVLENTERFVLHARSGNDTAAEAAAAAPPATSVDGITRR